MKNRFKKNEKGFALPLTLLLLVVMTIMGATLVTITTSEHTANSDKDVSQQAFYAAESGISIAKERVSKKPTELTTNSQSNQDNNLVFCKSSFFPNLRASNGFIIQRENLSDVIKAQSRDEKERLGKFSFEYFIGYSPNKDGYNTSAKKKQPGNKKTLYTVYSCGCDAPKDKCKADKNIIVPIEAVITLAN